MVEIKHSTGVAHEHVASVEGLFGASGVGETNREALESLVRQLVGLIQQRDDSNAKLIGMLNAVRDVLGVDHAPYCGAV